MWTHTYHAEGEARGTTITWAKWYEQDVIVSTLGGDGKRWRRLCVDTFAGADHRGKWVSFLPLGRNKTFQVLLQSERKTFSPIAMGP